MMPYKPKDDLKILKGGGVMGLWILMKKNNNIALNERAHRGDPNEPLVLGVTQQKCYAKN